MLLTAALVCLLLGLPLHWLNQRHFSQSRDTLSVLLLMGALPVLSLSGTVAALALLVTSRRSQHIFEILLGATLVLFLASWH